MTLAAGRRAATRFTVRDRRTIFLMSLVALVTGYGANVISHTLVFSRRALELSEGDMFWVFALTRAASLAGLAFALTADRRGRRGPFLAAFVLLPVANVFTGVLPGAVGFTASQSLARIAVIAVGALAVVILAEELTPAVRALGLGIYATALGLGAGFGLLLLPIAERSEGAYRVLFAITGVGLFIYPLLRRFLKESRAYVQHDTVVTFRQALTAGLGRHFWPLALMAFLVAAFTSPAFEFVLERLQDDLSWDAGAARFLLMVFSGIGGLGFLLGGRLADSWGRRPTTVMALVLGLVGGIAFYTQSSGWVLAPAILLASAGASMWTPTFTAHRSELFPTRIRATAAGWITNIAILGSITGFVLGATMVDSIGLSTTISILGTGVVVAALLVLKLPETRGMDLVRRRRARSAATAGAPPAAPASSLQSPTTPPIDPSPAAPPAITPPPS
jgi:MFS family permease